MRVLDEATAAEGRAEPAIVNRDDRLEAGAEIDEVVEVVVYRPMTSTTSLIPATEPSAPSLIKTDALGRMHRTPQQREQILDGLGF